jgi:hypothetical protein
LAQIAVIALGELKDSLQGEVWGRAGLSEDRGMFTSLLKKMKGLVEGIHGRGLEDRKEDFDDILWKLVDVPQTIASTTKETDDLIDIFPLDIRDLKSVETSDKGRGGLLSVRKKVIHHEDEEERTTLFGDLILVIGFTDLHP